MIFVVKKFYKYPKKCTVNSCHWKLLRSNFYIIIFIRFLRYTFAGGLDGHMEIFKSGEYGNLLERMETPFTFGIDAITSLRPNLLLVASSNSDEMRLILI